MALQPTHELHRRRFGRNIGVAGLLLAFVVLVFLLTVVKINRGEPVQGFDHTTRPELTPERMGTAPTTATNGEAAP